MLSPDSPKYHLSSMKLQKLSKYSYSDQINKFSPTFQGRITCHLLK